jgi:hypothetical protein
LQYVCDGAIGVYNGATNIHGDHGIARDFEGIDDGTSSPYGGDGAISPKGVVV